MADEGKAGYSWLAGIAITGVIQLVIFVRYLSATEGSIRQLGREIEINSRRIEITENRISLAESSLFQLRLDMAADANKPRNR